MTTKRQYGRPQMRVVELRQQCRILVGSGGFGASRTIYSHGRTDGLDITSDEVWQ